jgi:hypothetical protein
LSIEYKKSLEDEIDWKVIDQLHVATVNFSNTSLELKKLFFILVGIAVPCLIKLAGDSLDISLFITLYILTFTFWFLDSFTYYYQEKLREKMDKLFNQIKSRNKESPIPIDKQQQDFTIEITRTQKDRLWRSASNPSVRFYFVFFILISIGLTLLLANVIR